MKNPGILSASIYYLAIPFIYLVSILPFAVVFLISDGLSLMLYYVWGYRKNVVRENLVRAFPGKSKREINYLQRAYYRYLCDLFLETFKMLSISPESMLKHCKLDEESRELLDDLFINDESAILTLGHKGNWEWAGSVFSLVCRQSFYIVYHPLSSTAFDRLMHKMRVRFGAKLMTMSNAFKVLKQSKGATILSAFVADQSPPLNGAYWSLFMDRETPFFKGPERISTRLGQSVLYLSIRRIRRGYYTMHVERLACKNRNYRDGEITEMYIKVLEKDILSQPETWLWSHRRWKHKKNVQTETQLEKTQNRLL